MLTTHQVTAAYSTNLASSTLFSYFQFNVIPGQLKPKLSLISLITRRNAHTS